MNEKADQFSDISKMSFPALKPFMLSANADENSSSLTSLCFGAESLPARAISVNLSYILDSSSDDELSDIQRDIQKPRRETSVGKNQVLGRSEK